MTLPIAVRKIDEDGYISVRYLMPDGTEPQDDLPEELMLGRTLHRITVPWDQQYRLGIFEDYYPESQLKLNLMYLSDTNPLLFEEVLVFLESAPYLEFQIMSRRIMNNRMFPTKERPEATYYGLYRRVIDSAALLIDITSDCIVGMNSSEASKLLGDAYKCMGDFDHEHFEAAAVATRIVQKHTNKRVRLSRTDNEEDIAFIAENLHDVVKARKELARIGSIKKADIARMINAPTALRIGSL